MNLTFDPSKHLYALDGVPVPSVTQVLRRAGLIDESWYSTESAVRGTALHQAIEFAIADDLDWDSVDERIRDGVMLWNDFAKGAGLTILASEARVFHPTLRYAGTLDVRAMIDGKPAIFDIKSGGKEKWHGLQLAGYALCFDGPHERYAVYLKGGKLKCEKYEDDDDYAVFKSAVTIAHWKGSR